MQGTKEPGWLGLLTILRLNPDTVLKQPSKQTPVCHCQDERFHQKNFTAISLV